MPEPTYAFDAFISYRRQEPDKKFARDLLKSLQQLGYRVAFDEITFSPQASFLEEMERCVRSSRFVLAVVSSRYFESGNTQEEAIITKVMDMGDRQRRLIPLIIEEVERPFWIYNLVGINFTDPDPLMPPIERLQIALGKPSLDAEISQDEKVLPLASPTTQRRAVWEIVLDGELLPTFDHGCLVDDIVSQLSAVAGDTSLREISRDSVDGSVVIKLKGTEVGFRSVESAYQSDNLREFSGWSVEGVRLLNTSSNHNPLAANLQQRLKLTQRLAEIPVPQFEQMVFALQVPKGIVAGASAPQGHRVVSLLEWVESPGGCGIDSLTALLEDLINPR
jgi:hypothetical protein